MNETRSGAGFQPVEGNGTVRDDDEPTDGIRTDVDVPTVTSGRITTTQFVQIVADATAAYKAFDDAVREVNEVAATKRRSRFRVIEGDADA